MCSPPPPGPHTVAGLVNLISAGVGLHRWSLARDLIDGPAPVGDDSLRQAYTLAAMVGSFPVLSPAATGVVFLIWFHRVRTNGQVFRPDGFSQSSGRAIGAWFVPLGNVCLPYRIAKETWRAGVRRLLRPADSRRSRPGGRLRAQADRAAARQGHGAAHRPLTGLSRPPGR
ncbi:DUF4328 domain-containing protein [Streptomyces sp. NPDC029721]|uniref:DUF4328 domain-containing protein n=1 Tax=Streptomyces sp. NPDC029721 TaxID=3157090 RepID=UPI00340691FD